jgi:asparagine synthetase B (glutamine-hydrolysing)
MFFFAARGTHRQEECLRAEPYLLGSYHLVRHGEALLVWMEDSFTIGRQEADGVVVEVKRPGDEEPICSLKWHMSTGMVSIRRRWSGEFTVYISKRDFAVCSHLRAARLAYGRVPPGMILVPPGWGCSFNALTSDPIRWVQEQNFRERFEMDYEATVSAVQRLIHESVERRSDCGALLLSGGLDSSSVAAAARARGKHLQCFVFSLKHPIHQQILQEDDLACARIVSAHLGVPCTEILLDRHALAQNVPLAISLAETSRGTVIDDCTAYIEVARVVSRAGFSELWMGEGADDLFGSFKFPLRLYRGLQLRQYYQHELDVSLPNELAIIQKVFEPWGVALVQPFWTRALKIVGYNLPVAFRVDPRRLMKRVVRDAFAKLLPLEIVNRPKCITRDSTQIRDVLEAKFGCSRERYRPIFNKLFAPEEKWLAKKFPRLKN